MRWHLHTDAGSTAMAASMELPVTAEDGRPRALVRRPGEYLRDEDSFFVAAPEGAQEK
jgi:hypothetical protein